jgi:hypothetical protein
MVRDTKIKNYLAKYKNTTSCCDCEAGKCMDTSDCLCAYINYQMTNKVSCKYIVLTPDSYMIQGGKNKLLHNRWDISWQLYECNSDCLCNSNNKFQCRNYFEKPSHQINLNNLVIKRVKKVRAIKGQTHSHTMWGLFTTVNIPKNSFILEYTGEVWDAYNNRSFRMKQLRIRHMMTLTYPIYSM